MRHPGRRIRGWSAAALALLVALSTSAPCAAMTWPPFVPERVIDMAGVLDPIPSAPRLAVDPLTGRFHLAHQTGTLVWHLSLPVGATGADRIASGADLLDWAIGPTGRPAALCERPNGVVVVLRRDDAWSEDTVLTAPGWTFFGSLAIASDDAPVIALSADFLTNPFGRLLLAHRTPAGWRVSELDSVADWIARPSLALDASDRPRIAWVEGNPWFTPAPGSRWGSPAAPPLLYLAGESLEGPFGPVVVDGAWSEPSLALDPSSGEPRIAYQAQGTALAWRSGGRWKTGSFGFQLDGPPALSIAPDGSAALVADVYAMFAPRDGSEPSPACAGVATSSVVVAQSLRNDDPASFEITGRLRMPFSDATGPRGVVAMGAGRACVAWSVCGDSTAVWLARQDEPVVAPLPPGAVLGAGPNPARAGERIALSFRLEAPGDVSFTLHDVAGRRVAERAGERFGAGAHGVGWAPGALAPGVYQLVLRMDGRRLDARPLVVIH